MHSVKLPLLTIKSAWLSSCSSGTEITDKDYYHNYAISFGTDNYSTEPIPARKGVLRGDYFSQLLFNMVINTLEKTIDDEKVKCMGYNYCDIMSPHHWFQIVDDSALVTSTEEQLTLVKRIY